MSDGTPILDPALNTPLEVVEDPTAKTWDQYIEEEMRDYEKSQKRKAARRRNVTKRQQTKTASAAPCVSSSR